MNDIEKLKQQIKLLQQTVDDLRNGTVEVIKPITPTAKYKNLRCKIFFTYLDKSKYNYSDYWSVQEKAGAFVNAIFRLYKNIDVKKKYKTDYTNMPRILFGDKPTDEGNKEYITVYENIYNDVMKAISKYL